jgi:hypothetical protein
LKALALKALALKALALKALALKALSVPANGRKFHAGYSNALLERMQNAREIGGGRPAQLGGGGGCIEGGARRANDSHEAAQQ